MILQLTPEEQAWAERMQFNRRDKVDARRGPAGRQCRDCKHGVAHQHTATLFYCNVGTKLRKTQRTWTCDEFAGREGS